MLLNDIADLLSSGGVGTEGTDLFIGLMPEAPDVVTTVYETGGRAPVHAMAPAAARVVEMPRIQVVCRAGQWDYTVARTNANAVFKMLDGLGTRDINGVNYKWISAVQSPFLMGRDEAQRVLVGCNYDVVKETSP